MKVASESMLLRRVPKLTIERVVLATEYLVEELALLRVARTLLDAKAVTVLYNKPIALFLDFIDGRISEDGPTITGMSFLALSANPPEDERSGL